MIETGEWEPFSTTSHTVVLKRRGFDQIVTFGRNPEICVDAEHVVTPFDLAFDEGDIELLLSWHDFCDSPALAQVIATTTRGWPQLVRSTIHLLLETEAQNGMAAVSCVRAIVGALKNDLEVRLSDNQLDALALLASEGPFSLSVFGSTFGSLMISSLIELGAPISIRSDRLVEVSEVVRPVLAARISDRHTRAKLSSAFEDSGEELRAARLFLRAGQIPECQEVLSRLRPAATEELDCVELLGLLRATGPFRTATLAILEAKTLRIMGRNDEAREALGRVDWISCDDRRRREVEALDMTIEASRDGSGVLLKRIVAALKCTPGEELVTHAMLTTAEGMCLANSGTVVSLEESELPLIVAAQQWASLGYPEEAARTLRVYASMTLGELLRFEEAELVAVRALALCGSNPSSQLRCLLVACRSAAYIGRLDSFKTHHQRAKSLLEAGKLQWARAYLAWSQMLASAWQQQRDEVQMAFNQTLRHLGPLMQEHTGAVFLSEAAESFARVGNLDSALELLEQAKSHPKATPMIYRFAALAVAVATGDGPAATEMCGKITGGGNLSLHRRWRTVADAATAQWRRGGRADPDLVTEAFRIAEMDNSGDLLRKSFPEVFFDQALVPAPLVWIKVFGQFQVEVNGRPTTLSNGHAATLLKMLAIRGGAVQQDALQEALWPEIDPAIGRQRMRNVLIRCRAQVGKLAIVRNGDLVGFGTNVSSDLAEFERHTRRALSAQPGSDDCVNSALTALEHYGGALLPLDLYDDWINDRRVQTLRRVRLLLQLLNDEQSLPAARREHFELILNDAEKL